MKQAMKSGLGSASVRIGETGLIVGALVAVNAVGDVRDHETGKILAGARTTQNDGFLDSMSQILRGATVSASLGGHTTLGVIATNAILTKSEAAKVAQMAHDGLARTINPVHTGMDGDTIFAAATGKANAPADASTIGAVGAEVMARAVNRAVMAAISLPGLPAPADYQRKLRA